MKKVYIDLAIAIICIIFIIKNVALFLILVGIATIIWFFVLDDKKRIAIKDKIAEFYR